MSTLPTVSFDSHVFTTFHITVKVEGAFMTASFPILDICFGISNLKIYKRSKDVHFGKIVLRNLKGISDERLHMPKFARSKNANSDACSGESNVAVHTQNLGDQEWTWLLQLPYPLCDLRLVGPLAITVINEHLFFDLKWVCTSMLTDSALTISVCQSLSGVQRLYSWSRFTFPKIWMFKGLPC